jgi:hypothetical protein
MLIIVSSNKIPTYILSFISILILYNRALHDLVGDSISAFNLKLSSLILICLGSFIYLFSIPAITQDPIYHQFIDTRMFGEIPNTQDVLSNLFFIVVGLLGLKEALNKKVPRETPWIAFFASILLVAPGSAYYHWSPNNFTLVWDRLPMSLAFMALFIGLMSEHISRKSEKLLPWALLLGVSSVLVWAITGDLRFYFWIQFSSFIIIPLILIFFSSRYTHKLFYVFTLLFYGFAKWSEVKDREIFNWSHHFLSGHTLKHILAAIGIGGLWWMIKIRKKSNSGVKV